MLGLVSRRPPTRVEYLCCTRYSIVQQLSDKQSIKVICRFDRLRTAHMQQELKCRMSNAMLIVAHVFDYIALMINLGLTSCKDLATVVDISLDNNYSAYNASYAFSHIDVCLIWDNKSVLP